MKIKQKLKEVQKSWYFLFIIIITYFIIFFFDYDLFNSSLGFFLNILIKVIPIFVFVFVLMAITNYFITPDIIIKHMRKKGIKKWFFAVVGGILSTGPIYMWYPLLSDLKDKGLPNGLIACFLYNRAIKVPLLPLAIFYFGWKYIIFLTLIMIFVSIIQGMIINKFMEV